MPGSAAMSVRRRIVGLVASEAPECMTGQEITRFKASAMLNVVREVPRTCQFGIWQQQSGEICLQLSLGEPSTFIFVWQLQRRCTRRLQDLYRAKQASIVLMLQHGGQGGLILPNREHAGMVEENMRLKCRTQRSSTRQHIETILICRHAQSSKFH